jgi:glycosyltransferase involved in cell wall biosynthesis
MAKAAPSGPTVSLVICTRNRANQLAACLAAVAEIHCARSWETVIVDNGSRDDTRTVATGFLHDREHGHYVWEPRPGLSHARNAGTAASTGEIIAFTDDDCYPAPDLLDRICEAFADERIGFVGGRILLHDPGDYPLTINESLEPRRFAGGSVVPCAAVQGANMAFRRRVLLNIGGFDPALGAGTPFPAEDWDAVARACISGWDGGYFPAAAVFHHHGRNASEARRQLRAYHYASGAVYAKLLMDRTTRWPYGKHWARRILGDAKYHQYKLAQQFRGAIDYWRSARAGASGGLSS